jgi:hypothetical protein
MVEHQALGQITVLVEVGEQVLLGVMAQPQPAAMEALEPQVLYLAVV